MKTSALLLDPPIHGVLIVGQLIAFWPVWIWYGQRTIDGSDEPWGVMALVIALAIVFLRKPLHQPSSRVIAACTTLAVIYALGHSLLPDLVKGGLAAISLACLLSSMSYGRLVQPALAGLMMLSLPLIASLQFFGGFPLRLVTSYIVAFVLEAIGLEVQAQGTLLHWAGEIVAVDAPCAGIKMLWSGLFLNFTLAARADLNFGITWLCTSLTLLSVFAGNLLRTMTLFFVESGIVSAPDFMHQTIGLVAFGLVAAAVVFIHRSIRRSLP
ncbi:MAG: exosortase/archaeosortase family protein [Gammaproteobacteria bacterium]|nr:exosortase/archaeosortase family protein [Gammaproteobacteria bacterium]